ncbi:tagaturonate reductase [Anaerorhabdus sp.]|uniref:tagaturonate reductase n=1 Tax=Anaerorhabdus sp. TaxID=1872524 RepID=UPI002B1F7A3C|nr:tagaturonate reductase [Anaerorhabdus sp.]MEA4876239.1 tagaturonate reductase [Anaerorhabdus sp.]
MELLNRNYTHAKKRPVKIVQFGEGNFLRAFVDYMVDIANEENMFDGSIAIVKPISYGKLDLFEKQECQYSVLLRGLVDKEEYIEKRMITSIDSIYDCTVDYTSYLSLARIETVKYIVSNTTEAGIKCDENDKFEDKPAKSYPAKLTQFLYERAETFNYDYTKGLVMLPVELIDNNGDELKKCVYETIDKWNLKPEFKKWVKESCIFANTLVDRIVTGYPRNESETIWQQEGVQDELMVAAEPFALWVIESDKPINEEFPLDKALENKKGMSVIFTDNHKPYKQRKVRILNGAHTSFSLASYLSGNDTVLDSMNDPIIFGFMNKTINEEIIPTLDLPREDLLDFANQVEGRFKNPFIRHELLSISLNSVSKWKARCYPSVKQYIEKNHEIPKRLSFSLAALICFYHGIRKETGYLVGIRNENEYKIQDDQDILDFFYENKDTESLELVKCFVNKTNLFNDVELKDESINQISKYVTDIKLKGITECIKEDKLHE